MTYTEYWDVADTIRNWPMSESDWNATVSPENYQQLIHKLKTIPAIKNAANNLKAGHTVAFPTETVYGLGADATDSDAVRRIFQAKGRPADNPLIAHVADRDSLLRHVRHLPAYAERLIQAFTPGPITFVLPENGKCSDLVTAGLPTVGLRIPAHPIALGLIAASDLPIAAPSANTSGRPSPTTADHVWKDLGGKIAGVIDGGATGIGLESTVVDCTNENPVILRPGGISREAIARITELDVEDGFASGQQLPKAPGMKYTHYAPEVPLWIVDGDDDRLRDIIRHQQAEGQRVGVMATDEIVASIEADEVISLGSRHRLPDIAARLYGALRSFRSSSIDIIICPTFVEEGIGQAIMNRLIKAADRRI